MKRLKVSLAIFILFVLISPASAEDSSVPVSGVVVIDPGHGGEDKGAMGPAGALEKDVALDIAFRLAQSLKGRALSALLTRADDTFIPLDERSAFANASGALLFISIHANAAQKKEASGVETFFLSFEASDEDARRVAAFENSVLSYPGRDASEDGADEIKDILFDMASTEAHHESARLAEAVQTNLLLATGKENRGVRQAPFVVLVGATMPAILVEAGFITNPAEEKLLSSAAYRQKIAEAIAEGAASFIKTEGKGNHAGIGTAKN